MDCPECVRLLAEHQRLKAAHMVAFQEFAADTESQIDEHHGFWNAVDEAWLQAKHALLKLERHKRSHIRVD
jgi:hypothetical protein